MHCQVILGVVVMLCQVILHLLLSLLIASIFWLNILPCSFGFSSLCLSAPARASCFARLCPCTSEISLSTSILTWGLRWMARQGWWWWGPPPYLGLDQWIRSIRSFLRNSSLGGGGVGWFVKSNMLHCFLLSSPSPSLNLSEKVKDAIGSGPSVDLLARRQSGASKCTQRVFIVIYSFFYLLFIHKETDSLTANGSVQGWI